MAGQVVTSPASGKYAAFPVHNALALRLVSQKVRCNSSATTSHGQSLNRGKNTLATIGAPKTSMIARSNKRKTT
jgi:hypothetical protein